MSFLQVYVHAVWSTLNREQILKPEPRNSICSFITQYAASKDIRILVVNGWLDHMHCLFELNSEITLSRHIQYLKGGSAFWINKESGLFSSHFSWAQEYFAGSVSKDKLPMVEAYILQQEVHHSKLSFQEEYNQFMKHFLNE